MNLSKFLLVELTWIDTGSLLTPAPKIAMDSLVPNHCINLGNTTWGRLMAIFSHLGRHSPKYSISGTHLHRLPNSAFLCSFVPCLYLSPCRHGQSDSS